MERSKVFGGFFCRRQCLVPTLRGWLLLLLSFCALAIIGAREMGPFLMVNNPMPGGVLVVEGWLPDYAMEATVAEFNRNHYDKLFVTGIPLTQGAPLSEYKTYAELGAAAPKDMGRVMGAVKAKLAGQADMGQVSAAVKQALAK